MRPCEFRSRRTATLWFFCAAVGLCCLALSGRAAAVDLSSREKVLGGEHVAFAPGASERERTIAAEWLAQAARKGVVISVENAVVSGDLNLGYETLSNEVMLKNCDFERPVEFSYAVFKRKIDFSESTFRQGVSFQGADFSLRASFDKAQFLAGRVNFQDLHAHGLFEMNGAHFAKGARANFDHARFENYAYFNGSLFEDQAVFGDAQADSEVYFQGAVFRQPVVFGGLKADAIFFNTEPAKQATTFEARAVFSGIQITHTARFVNAEFYEVANFTDAQVGFFVDFQGAQFGIKGGNTNFVRVKVGGEAHFEDSRFGGPVSFSGAHIGSDAFFERVAFEGPTRFESTEFSGGAFFERAQFHGEAYFVRAEFRQEAFFSGVAFDQNADFGSAHFHEATRFGRKDESAQSGPDKKLGGASFGPVSFQQAHFEQLASFEDAVFRGSVNFRETSFNTVYFATAEDEGQSSGPQFQSDVDLRGWSYSRIQVNWESLLKMADGKRSRLTKYDRQVYTELERFFRSSGDDDTADNVYLERRRVERESLQGFWNRSADDFSRVTTNYGVSMWRLTDLCLILLFAGMVVFSRTAAVLPTEKTGGREEPDHPAPPVTLSHWDAMGVSLHQFLPLEVPLGDRWVPSVERIPVRVAVGRRTLFRVRIRPSTYAGALRIAGWILVPLQAAILSGALQQHSGP